MIVLGSRSPRRRELLALLVDARRIQVQPPIESQESGLDEVKTVDELSERLAEIAREKNRDVCSQLGDGSRSEIEAVLTADTVIVAFDDRQQPIVLGKPPDDDRWDEVVREWFEKYLLRSSHLAMTAVCLTTPAGARQEQVVTTQVTFRADAAEWIDWYVRTGEPRGKAGGYGLQGAGSLFVERIDGSPSNVIGLPLQETMEALQALEIDVG